MIPLHALVLILMGRFSSRLYVAYSSWYAIGTLASMQVPFVGFQPVRTSEHMAALGRFILLVSHSRAYLVINRCFRPFANRFLRLSRQVPRFLKAIPNSARRLRCDHWYFGHAWNCWPDVQRLHCPLDWKVLLALGYGICQKVMLRFLRMPFPAANLIYSQVYPYHRVSV